MIKPAANFMETTIDETDRILDGQWRLVSELGVVEFEIESDDDKLLNPELAYLDDASVLTLDEVDKLIQKSPPASDGREGWDY